MQRRRCQTDPAGPAQARFGARLRYWREHAGLSQAQLAHRLRYDKTHISHLESGRRAVSVAVARRVDVLLGAGGELAGLGVAVLAARRGNVTGTGDRLDGSPVPLPGSSDEHEVVLPWRTWRERVSRPLGLTCPLHADEPCVEAGLAEAEDGGGVHAHLGRLAILHQVGSEVLDPTPLATAVERVAGDLVRRATAPADLHLAADYAALAGQLRGEVGQSVAATGWLHRGASWADASGNTAALCRIFGLLSHFAQLERDVDSAARYALAARTADRTRRWAVAHGRLHQARVGALRGDRAEFARHVAAARRLIARFGERDRVEASWMTEGGVHVHALLSGGRRDLAARTGDRALARRAADTAQAALDLAPGHARPARLMLALRLADCLARAGERDAATHLAAPLLATAATSNLRLVQREYRSLRSSLPR
ncbi:helix-turn-helix transcriptional regulator [Saccharothrix sp. NPDC042600]|uniref:helix-turn-helix transcriptional regulator n=1 Tax=Saccharothrix TaxID=2071 RepID=UPI0033F72874|nr:hypothetical protein GCM10017745_40590 [Saccharothrix mutabilis subsp. capreolus]